MVSFRLSDGGKVSVFKWLEARTLYAKHNSKEAPIKWQPRYNGTVIVLCVVYIVYQHPWLLLMILEFLSLFFWKCGIMMLMEKLEFSFASNSCRVCSNFR